MYLIGDTPTRLVDYFGVYVYGGLLSSEICTLIGVVVERPTTFLGLQVPGPHLLTEGLWDVPVGSRC